MRVLLLALIFAPAIGIAGDISCPISLGKTEQVLPKVPQGWETIMSSAKHELNGFEVNEDGPMNDSAVIYDARKVVKSKDGSQTEILIWNLKGLYNPYAICGYHSTTISLVKSLKGLSKCEVISVNRASVDKFRIKSTRCY